MIELKTFQGDAARLISDRYALYDRFRPMRPGGRPRPFFQALSALTGSGKTPILAQAVTLLRAYYAIEPIVLWMSKARSVVGQTLTNFSPGGKYHSLLDGFHIEAIQDLEPSMIADGGVPLVLLTTTGVFNNKDQVAGHLKIYKTDQDLFGETSPWDRLKERKTTSGHRRPLIIVYDEGHNLSKQQSEILAELDCDAYLLASATMTLPELFQKTVVQHVLTWVEELQDAASLASVKAVAEDGTPSPALFITTTIPTEKIVNAQLVKQAIHFDGTTAPMERCIDDLCERIAMLGSESRRIGLTVAPKVIYVCKTNVNDDGSKDDPKAPFNLRQAPPIRIWRYLVERKLIPPGKVAIYADLDFAKGAKPDDLNLFSRGESDFDDFTSGNYSHIIFNQGLQEGWDDPACYCAYVDKSMGSPIQVEQLIGRVLRQYGAEHYESDSLNSAHFFLRVDKEAVFDDTIAKVQKKLSADGAPIEVTSTFGADGATAELLHPRFSDITLCEVHVDSSESRIVVAEELAKYPNYAEGDPSTSGQARTATRVIEITRPSDAGRTEWTSAGGTNPVRLRWLLTTAIRERSSRVLALTDLSDSKFDARVQINSPAAALVNDVAERLVQIHFQHSTLVYESNSPFSFGPVRVTKRPATFVHSLYQRYSGLNRFELEFAEALDKVGVRWHRNPNAGGYSIPLLTPGDAGSFRPDFVAWMGKKIFCMDTKGKHLLSEAVARKLFDIVDPDTDRTVLHVRLVSRGKQEALGAKATGGGFTVWKLRTGTASPIHVPTIERAISEALK
jgi:type III restriction enzyme